LPLRGKNVKMAVPWLRRIFDFILRHGLGLSRLLARPRDSVPWISAAFEKAGETFNLRYAPF